MDNFKRPVSSKRILITYFLSVIIFSCNSPKSSISINEAKIIARKDTMINIYQKIDSPSTLLLDINAKIDNDSSLLIVSLENSTIKNNRNIRDTIILKRGFTTLKYGRDLFEPYFKLYYKNKKVKEGEIRVNIKVY